MECWTASSSALHKRWCPQLLHDPCGWLAFHRGVQKVLGRDVFANNGSEVQRGPQRVERWWKQRFHFWKDVWLSSLMDFSSFQEPLWKRWRHTSSVSLALQDLRRSHVTAQKCHWLATLRCPRSSWRECLLWKNYHHVNVWQPQTLLSSSTNQEAHWIPQVQWQCWDQTSEFGSGKTRHGAETFWLLETYTDADWSANKRHRRSISCAVHMVNGSFTFASSRTRRVVSLSSAESELHAMVSWCSDAIFIRRCLEFLSCTRVTHQQWTDTFSSKDVGPKTRSWSH